MRVHPVLLVLLAFVLSACASGGGGPSLRRSNVNWKALWPEFVRPDATVEPYKPFPLPEPSAEQKAQLGAAERAWRARDDEGFEAQRAAIAGDPLAALWLTRVLYTHALHHLQQGTKRLTLHNPPWRRPMDAIVKMGAAGAPILVLDLLRSNQGDARTLASDLLREMGPDVLPSWQRIFTVDDPSVRRYAVQAMLEWGDAAATRPILENATRDEDFGVRAAAWTAYGSTGSDAAARLRSALPLESDPFVQRGILRGLGYAEDKESAATLVNFLERAIMAADGEGRRVATESLQKISGESYRDPTRWRAWLQEWEG